MNPKTILVVDDEFYTAEILSSVLEDEGFRVLTAVNGRDGLDKLKLSPIDLVILDIMMPIMNGAEMARTMRGDPVLANVPVLITSALSEAVAQEMVQRYQGFLRKPFQIQSVLAQVRTILQDADRQMARVGRPESIRQEAREHWSGRRLAEDENARSPEENQGERR